jgi:hypothetical protein
MISRMDETRLTFRIAEELQDASISKFPFVHSKQQEQD